MSLIISGDFDGDLIGIIPLGGLINENAVSNVTSSKQKGKGEMTLAEAVARSFYAKYLIPEADKIVSIASEQGKDLAYPRSILQGIIDSIKHCIDVPSVKEMKKLSGLKQNNKISPIATLIRGRLGSCKREYAFRYNSLVYRMQTEHTGCRWLRGIEKDFNFILSQNKQLKYTHHSKLTEYFNACDITGNPELKGVPEIKAARIPEEVLAPHRARLTRYARSVTEHCPEAYLLAHRVLDMWYEFGRQLRDGNVEDAYALIKEARELIREDERIGGLAMNYLLISVTFHGIDRRIKLNSYKMFSYLPAKIGNYDLSISMDRLGYERELDIRVIPPQA